MEGPTTGHLVYFIACNNFVKVGYTTDVFKRKAQLQTSNPVKLELVMTIGYQSESDAKRAEGRWRRILRESGGAWAMGEWVELEYNVIPYLLDKIRKIEAKHISEMVASTNAEILEEALASHGLRVDIHPSWAAFAHD